MPTWGKFCNFSCNDRTGTESCLIPEGDTGGEQCVFPVCKPSKLSGGTKSSLLILWGPISGLVRRGLEGKLPVNNGDVNGVETVVDGLGNPDILFTSDNLMPFRAQNVSSDRAWWTVFPESGLLEDSTRSIIRLQPNDGPFPLSTATNENVRLNNKRYRRGQ